MSGGGGCREVWGIMSGGVGRWGWGHSLFQWYSDQGKYVMLPVLDAVAGFFVVLGVS